MLVSKVSVCAGFMACALSCASDPQAKQVDAMPLVADAASNADATAPPAPPSTLQHWLSGNADDALVTPNGPALLLAGGGSDQDAGFSWAQELAPQGDLVILRTSGSDGYNSYLYDEIGGFDSVETLLVDTRDLADDAYVAWTLQHAEVIFMAGGDQWTYLDNWRGTKVQAELAAAWQRGAIIGGTSAGCAILGAFAFTGENDTVYSSEALADPYNHYMTLERDFLSYPLLAGVITDTHFAARDRMGRLAAFIARIMQDGWHASPLGIGIDEATALVVTSDGSARVIGTGAVYLVRAEAAPEQCESGLALGFSSLHYQRLTNGDTFTLPLGISQTSSQTLSISEGVMTPAIPYP